MKIYIIHYKKLVDRKQYLSNKLQDLNYEFVEHLDRDNFEMNDIFYGKNEKLWYERIEGLYNFGFQNPKYRDLQTSEICNALSHLYAIEKTIIENLDFSIILEDDAILDENFIKNMEYTLKNIPDNFDFVFFGSAFTMQGLDDATNSRSIKICDKLYKKEHGTARTVDGYIISNKACKLLKEKIKEIVLPFDFELNFFLKEYNMNVYWHEPGFIQQGSSTGAYRSSIR